ncbi:MAG: hypothetical protein ACI4PK_03285 [Oscillospiraceae bacterium]
MSILKLKNEYLEAAANLRDRVALLTEQYKQASHKEQSTLRRRIACLYTEIRELISTANSIDVYCSKKLLWRCKMATKISLYNDKWIEQITYQKSLEEYGESNTKLVNNLKKILKCAIKNELTEKQKKYTTVVLLW